MLPKVISSGSQRAFVWTAIQGREATSSRTFSGRNDWRNAWLKLVRTPGAAAADFADEPEAGRAPVAAGDPSSAVSFSGSAAAAAR